MWQEIQEFLQIHPASLFCLQLVWVRPHQSASFEENEEKLRRNRKLLQVDGKSPSPPPGGGHSYILFMTICRSESDWEDLLPSVWENGSHMKAWRAGEGLGRGCWIKAPPQFKVSVAVTRSSRSRQATPSSCSEWPSHQLMLWNVSKWMFNMRTKCSPKSNHPVLEWDQEKRGEPPRLAQIAIFPPFFFPSFESFKRDVFNCSSTTIAFSFAILSFPPEETRESSVFIFYFFPPPFWRL